MTFLLGRQAMFGQEPPRYFLSITAARLPWEASVQARYLPASPLPSTTRSYSSGSAMIVLPTACVVTLGSGPAAGRPPKRRGFGRCQDMLGRGTRSDASQERMRE